jgi:hypothetical protein
MPAAERIGAVDEHQVEVPMEPTVLESVVEDDAVSRGA